ncbi:MAG: DUF362 domain-containing protein [Spirochaetes bacterium]|nr:DUF362 domain-containing protein [Spirochaetota bacterium]MBU1080004.1 DUF362 domain-containing protein [Spirochaetota bacterium]
MPDKVGIYRAGSYDADALARALERSIGELGLGLPSGARVLVKPNIVSQNRPSQCTTTHPAVVDAICRIFADRGCTLTIGEASAFYETGYTARGFRTSGIAGVAAKYGARLVAFEEEGGRLHSGPSARALSSVLLARSLDECDFLVSAAKLKAHVFAKLSGAVKNLYGLVPGGAKFEYHYRGGENTRYAFGHKLCDIWEIARPGLSVLDAVWGLEGYGPASTGKPKRTGLLFVAANPWALDWQAARVVGSDPRALEIFRAGLERGALVDPDSIELRGDFPEPPSVPYEFPVLSEAVPPERDTVYRLVSFAPEVSARRCDGCGACVAACPPGAVEMTGTGAGARPLFDGETCLRCYHCFYSCTRRAIRLRGATLVNRPAMALRRLISL